MSELAKSEKVDYEQLVKELEKESLETSCFIQNLVEDVMGLQMKMTSELYEYDSADRLGKRELAYDNYSSLLSECLKIFASIGESRMYKSAPSKEFFLDIENSSNEIKAAVILNRHIKTKQECKDKGTSCGANMRETFLSEKFKEDARAMKVDFNKLDDAAKKKIMKVVNRDMKGGTPPTPDNY